MHHTTTSGGRIGRSTATMVALAAAAVTLAIGSPIGLMIGGLAVAFLLVPGRVA